MTIKMYIVLLATTLPASAQQWVQIHHVENQLLAPCCYAEPVARHGSEVAIQMRHEIETMILEGQSERQILDHYKALYGMAILVEPEGGYRAALYILPTAAVALGILLLAMFLRRSTTGGGFSLASANAGGPTPEEYRIRVQAALGSDEFRDRTQRTTRNQWPKP